MASTVPVKSNLYQEVFSPITAVKNIRQERIGIEEGKLILPNGMECLVISDPRTRESVCALTVGVGGYDNPIEFPGMAHFCEHTVLLGSEKYPEVDGYRKFLTEKNGQPNGTTGNDATIYRFRIAHNSVQEGLDRFASLFEAPLFDESALEREKKAVDQELTQGKENNDRLKDSVRKQFCNKNHPYSAFTAGNEETLKDVTQEEIRSWHDTHYSAHIMKVAVISTIALEALKEMVAQAFCNVPRRDVIQNNPKTTLFDPAHLGKLIYIKPHKKVRNLKISVEIPCGSIQKMKTELRVLSLILGDKGKGSLFSSLKKEGLIENLHAELDEEDRLHMWFNLCIELTEKGVKEKEKVLKSFFEAVASYKKKQIPDYIVIDHKKMTEFSYKYREMPDPYKDIAVFSRLMHAEPLATFPEKSLLGSDFNSDTYKRILDLLTPENCFYLMQAPKEEVDIPAESTESRLGAKFGAKLVELEKVDSSRDFNFPEENPYIPEDLQLLSSSQKMAQIRNTSSSEVYFGIDDAYKVPKTYAQFTLRSPHLNPINPESKIYSELYVRLLEEQIIEEVTKAEKAQIKLKIERDKKDGITFRFTGFLDKADLLLMHVLEKMKNADFSQEEFQRHLSAIKLNYSNFNVLKAEEVTDELLNERQYPNSLRREACYHASEKVSFEGLQGFIKPLWEKAFLSAVVYGNKAKEPVIQLCELFEQELGYRPYEKSSHFAYEKGMLASTPTIVSEKISACENGMLLNIHLETIPYDKEGLKKRAAALILSRFITRAYFNELRTKQQTGYIIYIKFEEYKGALSFSFKISSAYYAADDLLYRTEVFLQKFVQEIDSYEQRFNDLCPAVIAEWSAPGTDLDAQAERYVVNAADHGADFDFQEKKVKGLEELTFAYFKEFVQTKLGVSNNNRWALLAQGDPKEPKNPNEPLDKVEWPVVYTVEKKEG